MANKDYDKLNKILSDANLAKDRLYEVAQKLEAEGFYRKAKSCMTLVAEIEEWQRRK